MWVRSFKELDASCLPLAGGKAANLGELTRAGFPVPPGFCVLTTAYEAATEVLDLGAVAAEPSAANARALRERIMQLPPPPEVLAAVAEAYRALGPDVPVAVRSSATAEDLPGASFAGQQDTYLDMVGEAAVLDAVRRCWASLWTERAVSYRANQGIDPHGILAPQQGIGHNEKGEPTALVVDEKNFARLRVLKTGRAIGGQWQVLEGLKAGDRIIVEGLQKVQPDMPVVPQVMPENNQAKK